MSLSRPGFKALLSRLRSGGGVRAQLARGSLQGLIITVAGIGVGFLVQVAIARLIGVSEFGVYSWALAWINFLMLISCSGLDGLMSRRLPTYLMDGQHREARGFVLFSGYWIGGLALAGGIALYAFSWLSQERIMPGALPTLAVCILIAPLFALGALRQAILRAMKRVSQGQVLEALVRPIILAIVAAALIYGFGVGSTAVTAMTAQLVASAIVFVIGGVWVLRALPDAARHGSPYCARRSWLREAMPFLAISGASAVSRQVGILTLGVFATASDTGIYAAILRITEFAQMGTFSVAAIASPLIVEVLKKRDRQGLAQILKWGGRGAFGFGFLAVAGIVLLGGLILSAFGKEFPAGNGALHVMMLGALFGVFAGLSGILLAMSGHAGTRAGIGWASASCNLLGCLATVPHFGLHGAAFSYVFAMLVDGVLCLYFCWRYHKIWAGLR